MSWSTAAVLAATVLGAMALAKYLTRFLARHIGREVRGPSPVASRETELLARLKDAQVRLSAALLIVHEWQEDPDAMPAGAWQERIHRALVPGCGDVSKIGDPEPAASHVPRFCPYGEDRGPGQGCVKNEGHDGAHMLLSSGDDHE